MNINAAWFGVLEGKRAIFVHNLGSLRWKSYVIAVCKIICQSKRTGSEAGTPICTFPYFKHTSVLPYFLTNTQVVKGDIRKCSSRPPPLLSFSWLGLFRPRNTSSESGHTWGELGFPEPFCCPLPE